MKQLMKPEEFVIELYDAEKVANKGMNNQLDYAKQQGYEKGEEAGIQKSKQEMIIQMQKEGLKEETIMRIANVTQAELKEFK